MDNETPEDAERRLSHHRAEAADLLGELRSRATVSYVSRQAAGKALPALAALGPAAGRTAARNPVGSALMSAGLTWFLFGPEPDLPGIARKAATGTGSAVSKTASSVSHRVSHGASSALETVGDVAGKVAEGGRELAERLQDAGASLVSTTRRTVSAVPRAMPRDDGGLIAAAAFAGGIAVGLMVMRRDA